MKPCVGFVGTGVMGASMAAHLLNAGHELCVFNRTQAKAQALLDAGAIWCEGPGALARRCDVVFTIVGLPADVEAVYLGERGLIAQARAGTLLVDMTTSDPGLAERIAERAQAAGLEALDAPVSGGDVGARNATLSIMVGGSDGAFARGLPLLQAMGKTIVHQGPAGAGQYTKLCNQIAIAATMLSVCEAMAFARAAKLDPERVLESITTGAAGSWSLSNLMPRALKGDFAPGFSIEHFTKDLEIAFHCAETMHLHLPGLILARRLYNQLKERGNGALGTQALLRYYAT